MKFELTDDQIKQLSKWQQHQRQKTPDADTAIGGRWSYKFTPTSIGTAIKVYDGANGDWIDLSDYHMW